MNLLINPKYFYKNNEYQLLGSIYFLDSKPNNIMDGEFTKLLFSNKDMTLNGLYLEVNLHNIEEKPNDNKNKLILKFPSNHLNNISIIHSLVQLEQKILEAYMCKKRSKKQPRFSLHQQLTNGYIHAYYDFLSKVPTYTLKISGVWETPHSYGITYKFSRV
tara:strand:- start:91 stop:573 length:483 start_codon:yes stop_codon:yes gene_type:complete